MKKTHRTIRLQGGRKIALLNTSGYPDKSVVRCVRFALQGLDIDGTSVHIKKFGRGGYGGRAYYSVPSISNAPRWCRSLIVVRLGAFWSKDWTCELVNTTAHEGRHVDYRRQYGKGSGEKRAIAHAEMIERKWWESL